MSKELLQFNTERDIEEILKLISEYMRITYIKEVENAITASRQRNQIEIPKEALLLEAFIPFAPEENKPLLEEISNLFKYEQIMRLVIPNIISEQEESTDSINLKNIILRVLLYKIIKDMQNK